MTTALHIVYACPPEASKPTVLDHNVIARLSTINSATRLLREMGYRVVRQELHSARGHRPTIHIDGGTAQSIAPLLDGSSSRQWRNTGGKKCCHAEFHGVTVLWKQA